MYFCTFQYYIYSLILYVQNSRGIFPNTIITKIFILNIPDSDLVLMGCVQLFGHTLFFITDKAQSGLSSPIKALQSTVSCNTLITMNYREDDLSFL